MPRHIRRRSTSGLVAAFLVGVAVATASAIAGERMRFEATAYSDPGDETAVGSTARRGIVAADPSVLPYGTRIRVAGAGEYSGEYTVEDAGRSIKGREIDIHVASAKAAKTFGRKTVDVEVLHRGVSTRNQ